MNELEESRQSLLQKRYQMSAIRFELKLRKFIRSIKAGFDPDQPRDDDGRWAAEGSSGQEGTQDSSLKLAGRISPAREAECEELRMHDEIQCRFVGLRACWAQAAPRYANCLRGSPIPPLNY